MIRTILFLYLQLACQAAIFDFTMNQKFDVAIMIFIMLNMITMCMEYDGQPVEYTEVWTTATIIFLAKSHLELVISLRDDVHCC